MKHSPEPKWRERQGRGKPQSENFLLLRSLKLLSCDFLCPLFASLRSPSNVFSSVLLFIKFFSCCEDFSRGPNTGEGACGPNVLFRCLIFSVSPCLCSGFVWLRPGPALCNLCHVFHRTSTRINLFFMKRTLLFHKPRLASSVLSALRDGAFVYALAKPVATGRSAIKHHRRSKSCADYCFPY